MALTCSNCEKELPDDTRFCSECGTLVAEQEKKPDYCANCFAELSDNAKFCLQCGKPAIVAAAYITPPLRDQSFLDKLQSTSRMQQNFRAHEIAHKAWEKTPLAFNEPELNFDDIVDFERNKTKIPGRVQEWVKYVTSEWERINWFQSLASNLSNFFGVDDAWSMETGWFRTNKPNHHKALFYELFIDQCLYKLHQHDALTYDTPPAPTPLFLDYLRKVRGFTDEDMEEWQFEVPDIEEIKKWPRKDDDLFPPPQPVTVEAAGGIIGFTTDEAVVVVYLDCLYRGKEIELKSVRNEELYIKQQKATVIERTSGNSPLCVAIFRPVLFATEEMKNRAKVINQVKVEVSASWSANDEISSEEAQKLSYEDKIMWFNHREEFILFKGDVKQIDWRGRRGKVERIYNR